MSRDEMNLEIFNSFGYRNIKDNGNYKYTKQDFWHPGFAWAITRKAYEQLGGLYDKGIVGSGDSIMAYSLINRVNIMHKKEFHEDYNQSMDDYQSNASNLRVGYVPGVIRHHYHGSTSNRKYVERWEILVSNEYSPKNHITYDEIGVRIPTPECPPQLLIDVMNYFIERKEDD